MILIDYKVVDDCQNLEESYGEICVKCNKCNRFNKMKYNPCPKCDCSTCATKKTCGDCKKCGNAYTVNCKSYIKQEGGDDDKR